jgi:hypothetical protein
MQIEKWLRRLGRIALVHLAVSGCRQDGGDGGDSGDGGDGGGSAVSQSDEVWLGRSCRADEDCGGSLRCLGADDDHTDGGGAPPGGLCTLACEQDSDCRGFDATAVCGTLGESPLDREFATDPVPRFCLLGCSLGSPAGVTKCHGRVDLACRPFAPNGVEQCQEDGSCPNGGFCFRDRCRELACGPRCNADSDCSNDRACNPQTGLCDVDPAPRVPVGAACDTDRPDEINCGSGTCLILFDADGVREKGLCTQSCTLGQRCGEDSGACVMPRFQDYAVGDIAYCAETCDCNDDCRQPGDACWPWDSAEAAEKFGSAGTCEVLARDETTLGCEQPESP